MKRNAILLTLCLFFISTIANATVIIGRTNNVFVGSTITVDRVNTKTQVLGTNAAVSNWPNLYSVNGISNNININFDSSFSSETNGNIISYKLSGDISTTNIHLTGITNTFIIYNYSNKTNAWYSRDRNVTWYSLTNPGFDLKGNWSIRDENTIYACTAVSNNSQVYISTNRASTWTIFTKSGLSYFGNACQVHPENGNDLFATAGPTEATRSLYKFDFDLYQWNEVSPRDLQQVTRLIAIDENILLYSVTNSSYSIGAAKSIDGGNTWTTISDGNVNSIASSDGNIIYITRTGAPEVNGVWRSINGGTDWTRVLTFSGNNMSWVDTYDGVNVVASYSNTPPDLNYYISTNSGADWVNADSLISTNAGVCSIFSGTATATRIIDAFGTDGGSGSINNFGITDADAYRGDWGNIISNWGNHATAGYVTNSVANHITTNDTNQWTTAYEWGDHSTNHYVTNTVVDRVTSTDTNQWATAYGWGNHATNNYANKIYQTISNIDVSGVLTTISVVESAPIYYVDVDQDTEIEWDLDGLNLNGQAATWEAWFKVATPSVTLTLPSSTDVYYLEEPDPSTTEDNQIHYTVWRAFITGATVNVWCNQWRTK